MSKFDFDFSTSSSGTVEVQEPGRKQRGNGAGSVRQLPDGRWEAVITTGLYTIVDDAGVERERRHVKKKRCKTQAEAERALGDLWSAYGEEKRGGHSGNLTLQQVYDSWAIWYEPDVGPSTMENYSAAFKHLKTLAGYKLGDITIDDWQRAMDGCPAGKRTRQNIKCLIGLLYKYAIPRSMCGGRQENLGTFLKVRYDKRQENIQRESLTDQELQWIWALAESGDQDARDVISLIYLGCRPSEFLDLKVENLNREEQYIIGGAKTDAGRDRIITISPRIWDYIVARVGDRTEGFLFCHTDPQYYSKQWTLKRWTEGRFYAVLERAGIDNPVVAAGGGTKRRRITPHSCRHTFARLAAKVDAPAENISLLIGHSDTAMTRAYMDLTLNERRRITDQL